MFVVLTQAVFGWVNLALNILNITLLLEGLCPFSTQMCYKPRICGVSTGHLKMHHKHFFSNNSVKRRCRALI